MKVLLISYDNEAHINSFPLGLAYIAQAIREEGHEIEIYFQDIYHYPDEHITEFLDHHYFDAIGIGACGGYYQYRKIKSICQAVKNADKNHMLFLGGHLVSPEPEYFLRKFHADVVIMGEGELTTKELLKAYDKEKRHFRDLDKILGLAYKDENGNCVVNQRRPVIKDLNTISFPAYDLFPMDHYALMRYPNAKRTDRCAFMISGRGCPYTCNFCYRMDKGFRPRSADSIIKEVKLLQKEYAITYFTFNDELLMSSVERTVELCNRFIEEDLKIRWLCNGRLNFASKDIEMLRLMKKAGCVFINYGIESMDNAALKNMNKALTTEMIIKGIENTLEAEISPGLNIIFGNIGESRKSIENDVEFLLKYDDHCQLRTIRPVTPYPGSPLYYYAIEKGLLNGIEDFYENKHTNSDLMTCNFTDLSDEDYYEALHWANSVLLKNHLVAQEKANKEVLDKLYLDKDSNFRGFRMT